MAIEASVDRFAYSDRWTLSRVLLPGFDRLYGVEDRIRAPGVKIPGQTAIPAGRYRLAWEWSPRFRRHLPTVLEVPGFSGIRWHAGNSYLDTEGCLCVGREARLNSGLVTESREAMRLITEWFERKTKDEIWVTYRNLAPPSHLLERV